MREFGYLLRAEWTKFRTLRGQLVAATAAAVLVVLLGAVFAAGNHSSCSEGPKEVACPTPPLGPGGEAVADTFYFVHRTLSGDGTVTARLTSLTGVITYPPPNHDTIVPRVEGLARAGLMVKAGARPGASYAALAMTGTHGVRLAWDFTHEVAGAPGRVSGAAPRWLRLVRAGDTLTGYESVDGHRWTRVGVAHPAALPRSVQVGLFVSSPGDVTVEQGSLGGSIEQLRFTQATGVFDRVSVAGTAAGGDWRRDYVGGHAATDWEKYHRPPGLVASGDRLTISGSGEIAPSTDGFHLEGVLSGLYVGLIVLIVVAVLAVTAEYRRGVIATTLVAGPRRGTVLAAKAVVVGAVGFVAGLVATAVTVPVGVHVLRGNGIYVLPVPLGTELRVVVGTAAVVGLVSVLALALGAVFRRGPVAVIAAVAVTVLPVLLATASFVPEGLSRWLLRITPAAGFAVQQSIPVYPNAVGHHSPVDGYYPLPPWAGFAVLCGFAGLALALAGYLLRRRDA
ncbi:MAG TPA: ABC transporter permease subunit [Actinocatenispora sp.]